MPEELHELVKARADEAGVSLTAYVLSVLETDLNTDPLKRTTLSSLAVRVRAIEDHLGLDSRNPGYRRAQMAAAAAVSPPILPGDQPPTERRRSSDQQQASPTAESGA